MDCPTCGQSLATERGMRQHHTKVHDEPLPNRTCNGCNAEFYDPKSRRSYCDDCNPNAGEHNGNWKGGTETASCKRCESTFEYYPSDKPGVYCSDCVVGADDFLGTPYYEYHDIERVQKVCEWCGKISTVLKSRTEREPVRFCSQVCLSRWLSDQWEDSENAYNGRWREVRRQALERDDHSCQHCGITREEIGHEPDVHHIKPVREFNDQQLAHTLDNVICLCRSCHRYAEIKSIDGLSPSNSRSKQ
ncbi:HNH endonuclease [Natronolimnohabitans innermongolicus]|uniref:HNH endonuclease n=1 Tax=Natronolimnohabitans innermongolicus JCM 12255 TaxID=1227499 RepID=L9XIW6_9EURY|nr:HNH endonuclease signature motif containing protein [Natronolimnohabitans innermongolicus]ELY60603.1 HNH endonuclease [Natronolimnohabitans innermongolicus JCM 12255]